MIKLKQAIIVEGRYDKIKLKSILDAVIIETDGFGIYKNKEKLELIKTFAEKSGIIIITDSDNAGLQIRNYLKNVIKKGTVNHIYIPDVYGREKRKAVPSKEGKLGVEGIDAEILRKAFEKAGAVFSADNLDNNADNNTISSRAERIRLIRERLYSGGFTGAEGASFRKKELLKTLSLPENLSTPALIEVFASLYSENFEEVLQAVILKINKKQETI